MAYLMKSLFCCCFLLVVVIFPPLQVQARESKFLNKFTHISAPTPPPASAPSEFEVSVPAVAPALAPTLFYRDRGNAYGLYGKIESNQFPPTKEIETTIDESDLLNEQLSSAENYETSNQNSNYNNNGYSNTGYTTVNYNKEYTNNNDGYTSKYNYNGYSGNAGYSNNGYSSNYNTDGYENEKKGMSDTRYLDNGKYYYNVKNENNYPATYESERQSGTVKYKGSYGNTQSAYEFNTMEEYENQQGFGVNPENYVP